VNPIQECKLCLQGNFWLIDHITLSFLQMKQVFHQLDNFFLFPQQGRCAVDKKSDTKSHMQEMYNKHAWAITAQFL